MTVKKILVADDSATTRAVLRYELEKGGQYNIYEACNGTEALQLAEDLMPDLITLDVIMPDMTGYQVCTQIRKLASPASNVPIIFLTASDTLETRQRGFRVGGNDFIIKPFAPSELQTAVEAQLHRDHASEGGTILVADSSCELFNSLTQALAHKNFKLVRAESGDQALEIITKNSTKIDGVITEYALPGISGEELCRAIRHDVGDLMLPIICVVSYRELAQQLFEAGASDYLQIPYTTAELVARVQSHLNPMITNRQLHQNLINGKKLTRELENRNRELTHAQRTIQLKTSEITSDLLVASEFQKKYLGNSEVPAYLDIALYYQPVSYVSGDFYMIRTNHKDECNILIGDVAGHGIGPAFITIIAKTLLDRVIDQGSISEMMTNLNTSVEEIVAADSYLTSVLVRISKSGDFVVANAGHPETLVLRKQTNSIERIKPEGTPLGMFDADTAFFEEVSGRLEPGDKLVLLTDGLLEQTNKKGEPYEKERLEAVLLNNSRLHPESIIEKLTSNLQDHVGTAEIIDDQTVIIIEYR